LRNRPLGRLSAMMAKSERVKGKKEEKTSRVGRKVV
jgi:hypothetical protein